MFLFHFFVIFILTILSKKTISNQLMTFLNVNSFFTTTKRSHNLFSHLIEERSLWQNALKIENLLIEFNQNWWEISSLLALYSMRCNESHSWFERACTINKHIQLSLWHTFIRFQTVDVSKTNLVIDHNIHSWLN